MHPLDRELLPHRISAASAPVVPAALIDPRVSAHTLPAVDRHALAALADARRVRRGGPQ